MTTPTEQIATAPVITIDDLRKDGVVSQKPRVYQSKRMTGFNQEVYSAWIERWANNAAINYPIINDSWGVRFLFKSCRNLPALVVGIGPSLDDNIQFLKAAKERCIVISTDAALRPLLRHGIKPDLVVNYDGRHEQRSMWETIDTADLTLVANSITSPHTIDAWKGKQIFFNMMQLDDEYATNILPAMYPHLGSLPNMGTVGNGAIYLAHEMGCSPILTVGMDLCYKQRHDLNSLVTPSWNYRCKDYLFEKPSAEFPEGFWRETENKILYDNEKRMEKTFEKEYKGKVFHIDDALRFYADSLLGHIGRLDLPVIDCSGGVLAQFIKHLPLGKALEEKCAQPIFDGQTVVRHLNKITIDGKRGRVYDDTDFWHKP